MTTLEGRAWAAQETSNGPVVRLDLAPDQSKYDAADENLRDAANMLQSALNAASVEVCYNRYDDMSQSHSC